MRTDSQNRHRARSRSITGLVLCLPLLASLFGSSGFAQTASDGRLSVIVTIQPWASLSRDVGGEHVDVVTLLPAGASPHAFDPAPSQAVALARADIVIMNGGLDDWLLRLLDATAADVPRFTALDVLDPDALSDSHEDVVGGSGEHDHHDDDDDHGHDHGGINSHVWLDPVLASHVVTAIADEFAAIDPANAESYLENAARVVARLHELDVELREILDPVAGSGMVPFHDAWVHFARRYRLEILATLEPFPGREPSAAYLTSAVETITAAGVTVIFSEGQLNDRTAYVVAESAGVAIAALDPLGGAPGPLDYFELLRWNASIIAEALGRP